MIKDSQENLLLYGWFTGNICGEFNEAKISIRAQISYDNSDFLLLEVEKVSETVFSVKIVFPKFILRTEVCYCLGKIVLNKGITLHSEHDIKFEKQEDKESLTVHLCSGTEMVKKVADVTLFADNNVVECNQLSGVCLTTYVDKCAYVPPSHSIVRVVISEVFNSVCILFRDIKIDVYETILRAEIKRNGQIVIENSEDLAFLFVPKKTDECSQCDNHSK